MSPNDSSRPSDCDAPFAAQVLPSEYSDSSTLTQADRERRAGDYTSQSSQQHLPDEDSASYGASHYAHDTSSGAEVRDAAVFERDTERPARPLPRTSHAYSDSDLTDQLNNMSMRNAQDYNKPTHPLAQSTAVGDYDTDDNEDYPSTAPKAESVPELAQMPSHSSELAVSPYSEEHDVKASPSLGATAGGEVPTTPGLGSGHALPTAPALSSEHAHGEVAHGEVVTPATSGSHDAHDAENQAAAGASSGDHAGATHKKEGIIEKVTHLLSGGHKSASEKHEHKEKEGSKHDEI